MIPTSSDAPFKLPLSLDQFRRAMSNGHGRTWLHISKHGAAGIEDQLTRALLHSLAFDTQCEGDRGPWVMAMVDESRTGTTLYRKFIQCVHDAPDDDYDYWHISQRGTVLAELAKRGVADARISLDRLFVENRTKHPNELLGALDIIEVDGVQGLLQVCSALGHEAVERNADAIDDWCLNVFDEDRNEGDGLKILEAKRGVDLGIDRFLSVREAEKTRREAAKQAKQERPLHPKAAPVIQSYTDIPRAYHQLPADEIIKWVENAPQQEGQHPSTVEGRGWLRGWGIRASESALTQVLEALDHTDSSIEIRRYLTVFSRRSMPLLSDRVVALAESDDEHVRSRAYAALKNVTDPRIRAVALRSMTPELIGSGSLELFQSSYEPGDHAAIEQALFVPDDVGELHSLIFDLADICSHTKLRECLTLMLFVYEYSPCGNCRGKVVDAMVDLDIAPDWLADECRFDAMNDIRVKFGGPNLED